MSTLSRDHAPKTRTLLHSNPVLSRLSKITERSETDSATYAGIARKTLYFLAITLVGMIAQLLVSAAFAGEPVWQTIDVYEKFTVSLNMKETVVLGVVTLAGFLFEMVGIFASKTIPVTGTLYSASQGYFISFLVFKVLKGYEYLGLEALLLTVAVVAVMSFVYSSDLIRGGKKYRVVMFSLMLGTIVVALLTFIGTLIPATRPYAMAIVQNPLISIGMDVVGLLISSLFLISDFSMIDDCVKLYYPKEYEWSAAFGLVFTVIWIYLKILDLLMQFAGKKKD